MADKTILKQIPLSIEGYIASYEKEEYGGNLGWSISAILRNPNYDYLTSCSVETSWDGLKYHTTEEDVLSKFEDYLTKICTYDDAVKKTVDWWASVSFNVGLNQNNGDDSPEGAFGFALANILSLNAQKEITEDQIATFKSVLYNAMNTGYQHDLSVDYDPVQELRTACEIAHISTHCLPIKTNSMINRHTGVVTVSLGYHGERKFL